MGYGVKLKESLALCFWFSVSQFIYLLLFFQGQICSSGSCVPGCRTDSDCPNEKQCSGKQCRDPCSTGLSPCGVNAVCRAAEHRAVCLCPDGYQGEPSQGCQPYECKRDSDCESDKACGPDRACRNPCLESSACGANAQCRVVNRLKQCSCPLGLIGNPEVECRQGNFFWTNSFYIARP